MSKILVPSIAGSMLSRDKTVLEITPLTPEEFAKELQNEAVIINYIRHPATVQQLQSLLPNVQQAKSPEYHISPSDIIYMVSLANRAPTPGAEVAVQDLSQLVIYRVRVVV